MNFNCLRSSLLAALGAVRDAVPAKATMPVYQNVKLVAAGDSLTLIATDLEVAVRSELTGAEVDTPGEVLLPASRLASILRESAAELVRVKTEGKLILVRLDSADFELASEDVATFSDPNPTGSARSEFFIAAESLANELHRVRFAAASDEGKYSMRAVLWDLAPQELRLVATDGKRLAIGKIRLAVPHGIKPVSLLLPPKAMGLLEKLLHAAEPGTLASVELQPGFCHIRVGVSAVYTRVVEGRYPPYRDVIPKKFAASVNLPVGPFLRAIRQTAVMTEVESERVTFAFGPDKLVLSAGGQAGKSNCTMPLDGYTGNPIEICFDPKYLVEMLRCFGDKDVLAFNLTDSKHPAVLSSEGYTYLVVPMV